MDGFAAIDISSTGLAAERFRMELTANNIANAGTTRTDDGTPFRRQLAVLGAAENSSGGQGVQVTGVESDQTEFPVVYNPGHPHADEQGFLQLSNVSVPQEMVDLITASRAYEANTKAIALFKEMVEQSLSLLEGGR